MTTRDSARREGIRYSMARRRAEGNAPPPIESGPSLPERLLAARERKGVDLYRAERDTKIRARYLSALERGEYRELPGAVYTKGFLRNYAVYLGLDPDDVLLQWRNERGERANPDPVLVVPRPISAPQRGLTVSPSLVVGALMVMFIVGFGAYVAVQLLRFAKPPTLAVTRPATALVDASETDTTYLLQGTSAAGATVSVVVPGRTQPYLATADSDGTWSVQVDLRAGKNQFTITATDPDTGKQAENPASVVINVPYLVSQAPTLSIDQPVDGTTYQNGAIPLQGKTANAKSVTVTATWLGRAAGQPTLKSPAPSAQASPPAVAPVTVDVHDDGSFSSPLELTAGKWSITVTASSAEGKTASLSRTVTVAYKGVNLVISIKGGRAWLKVWLDGVIDPKLGAGGVVEGDGVTLTYTAQQSIEVRSGCAAVTNFTLNGTSLGALDNTCNAETWLFQPPNQPTKTQRR
ncbi:MAG TPA: helix-turn-helix domain-containing protein [Candidatus Limnocylindrales bacterium]|jgi:cytoskeletal protein RodZ